MRLGSRILRGFEGEKARGELVFGRWGMARPLEQGEGSSILFQVRHSHLGSPDCSRSIEVIGGASIEVRHWQLAQRLRQHGHPLPLFSHLRVAQFLRDSENRGLPRTL